MAGICAALDAILRRGKDGGSYQVDVRARFTSDANPINSEQIALNYYSQWLVNSVGVYPKSVWERLWAQNGNLVFRHHQGMTQTLRPVMGALTKNSASKLFKPSYFQVSPSSALKNNVAMVKPILQFPQEKVKPGYQVGVRGNGVDVAEWPVDLMTEIIS